MTQIELKQAQEHLLELIELAVQGEEIIIYKNKKPLVKLIPISPKRQLRQFGSAKGLIVIEDDFDEPLEEFEEYM